MTQSQSTLDILHIPLGKNHHKTQIKVEIKFEFSTKIIMLHCINLTC